MERKIAALVLPTLEGMGYELVRVLIVIQGKGSRILQVMAERQDRAAMSVEDCARLSRAVSAVLDIADLIQWPYVLEVSSPGLERPLTKLGDFARFAGSETRLKTWQSIAGRRRFRGRLLGISAAGAVRLALHEGKEVLIPHAEVAKAKLIFAEESDESVAAQDSKERYRRHRKSKESNRQPKKRQERDQKEQGIRDR